MSGAKVCERDPDTFFSLFEHVADSRGWPDSERTLLLHCILTGKAEQVDASFPVNNSQSCTAVNVAVFKAYELVPVAYQQKFKAQEWSGKHMHMDFGRKLETLFAGVQRWKLKHLLICAMQWLWSHSKILC